MCHGVKRADSGIKSLSKYVTVFTSAYKITARKTGGQEAVRHGTTCILAFDVNVKYHSLF